MLDVSKLFSVFFLLQARPAGDQLDARDGQQEGKSSDVLHITVERERKVEICIIRIKLQKFIWTRMYVQ